VDTPLSIVPVTICDALHLTRAALRTTSRRSSRRSSPPLTVAAPTTSLRRVSFAPVRWPEDILVAAGWWLTWGVGGGDEGGGVHRPDVLPVWSVASGTAVAGRLGESVPEFPNAPAPLCSVVRLIAGPSGSSQRGAAAQRRPLLHLGWGRNACCGTFMDGNKS